jgi:hypothetical protein
MVKQHRASKENSMLWWLGVIACSWLASGAIIPAMWQFSKLRRSGEPSGEKMATTIPLEENCPQAMSADVPGGEGVVAPIWAAP